ncbi:hypothetical protein [Streptomyces sp. B22F1]|uniref:hypothetical protein n=1 Tax=Streptomyces sp. B22F1 TaxID=3153566 RepID=UPI00325DB3E4
MRWQDDAARLAHDLTRVVGELGLAGTRLHDAQSGRAALVDVVWEHLAAVRGVVIVIDNVDTPATPTPPQPPHPRKPQQPRGRTGRGRRGLSGNVTPGKKP